MSRGRGRRPGHFSEQRATVPGLAALGERVTVVQIAAACTHEGCLRPPEFVVVVISGQLAGSFAQLCTEHRDEQISAGGLVRPS